MSDQPDSGNPVNSPDDRWVPPRSGLIDPRTGVMLIACLFAVILSAVVVLLPVKYAIMQPGPVLNTLGEVDGKPLISVSGHQTYETTGTLDLTTVSLLGGPDRKVTLLQVVDGWLRGSKAVVPEEQVFTPGETQEESDAENQAEMTSSQESATAAALWALDIDVPTTLTVAGTAEGSPAADVLEEKDVITAVNGTAIGDLADLRTTLAGLEAGAKITVTVQRDGKKRTLTTETMKNDAGDTVLGIYITPDFDFPFDVKIQIEDIGGPSAGMMFALGIIDTLTPGDLTGGKHIAGTGTIDADGTVGAIGGIRQKLVGARQAGADYFLAPADNCDEVAGHVPDGLQVIRVETLDQARTDVEAIADGTASGLKGCE
ncbi:PDZ domain-containing protein [Kineosporia sp. J2-2]|uniref:endopeptidase La n=1 Tax=Kineosporia corallincola TaxID=2835133 RepID=A0ABS5TB05_9ACTN|nr:PDZ domain-containing protein [Kineosporia corallincola]MBT0768023.1 PDZ domain-containing protein [Kineosporia corallincola]